MPRGRPQTAPARSLNVRVEVSDLDKLALLQTITGKSTADVVREAVRAYIATNEDKLREAGERLARGDYF
jgi:predicted DNA-binding protein